MRGLTWLAVGSLLVAALPACGGGGRDGDSGGDAGPGRSADGGAAPGPGDGGGEAAERPEIVQLQLTIDDADLGPLTFDALAAGDPEAASRGRLVLLLHGFPETSEAYREILPALAAEGWYAVAPDQRGYSPGARPPAVGDYGIAHVVDDTLALASELDADTFHLVGHDWGGGVAWVTAAWHPDRVTTLSVLSTPHPDALSDAFTAPGSEQPALSGYLDVFAAPGSETSFLGGDTFVNAFSAAGLPREKTEAYAELLANEEALRAALNWYRANPIPSPARLGPVAVPTLYIWGTEDLALGRTAAEATADHVTAPYELVVLDGEGHWLPETVPDEIAARVLDQLATGEGAGG